MASIAVAILALSLGAVEFASRWNPLDNSGRQLATGFVVAALLTPAVWWVSAPSQRNAAVVVWVVKALVTLVAMLVYESRYDVLDAYDYFYASQRIHLSIESLGYGEGTRLVEALTYLAALLVGGSYHAVKVLFSFAGMVGLLLFSRTFEVIVGRDVPYAPFAFGLLPSALLWSSILGKDPLVLLGLGLFFLGSVSLRKNEGRAILLMALGVLVVGAIRVWLVPLMAGIGVLVVVGGPRSAGFKLTVVMLAGVSSVAAWNFLAERFLGGGQLEVLGRLADISQDWARGSSAQVIEQDISTVSGFLSFLPSGVIAAAARPFPFEANNLFALLAGGESMLLWGAVATVLWKSRGDPSRFRAPVWVWAYLAGWLLLYAPISFQNLGTAVRFRLQILPVLILIVLLGITPRIPRISPLRRPANETR